MSWRARDRATDQVVALSAGDTKEEFLKALIEKYGEDWVLGTALYPPRLAIEEVTEASA